MLLISIEKWNIKEFTYFLPCPFVGMSSGAAMYITLKKAKELGKGKKIVVIFPDNGYKYLSNCLFED